MNHRRNRNESSGSIDCQELLDSGYISPDQGLNSPYDPTVHVNSPRLEDEVEEGIYREFMVSDDDVGGDSSDLPDGKAPPADILKVRPQVMLNHPDLAAWRDDLDEDDELEADDEGGPASSSALEGETEATMRTPKAAPDLLELPHTDSQEIPSKRAEDALLTDDKPWRRTPFRGGRGKDSPSGTPGGGPQFFRYFRNKLSKQPPPAIDTGINENETALEAEDAGYEEDVEVEDTMQGEDGPGEGEDGPGEDEDGPGEDEVQADFSDASGSTESEQGGDEDDFLEDDDEVFLWEDGDEQDAPVWDPRIDWDGIVANPLPNQFVRSMGYHRGSSHRRRLSSASFSDAAAKAPMDRSESSRLAWEHSLFLQSVWQLLTERDFIGVEGSIDLSDNIWKKGPLKKWTLAVRKNSHKWKVKYCEVRRGNLCYYEDSGQEVRKTIHLRRSDTVVQARTDHRGAFVFEIVQTGSPTRLWMAKSEEDLQAWIRTLQAAMIGGDQDLSEVRPSSNYSAYRKGMDAYLQLQSKINALDVHLDYTAAVGNLAASPIQVPVRWIRDLPTMGVNRGTSASAAGHMSDKLKPSRHSGPSHKNVQNSIHQFWKNMRQTTFGVNGIVVPKESPLAAERIVGALTRCILEFDHAFAEESEIDMDPANLISELQALSYTRDILLSVSRSKQQQDVICAVQRLLRNDSLVKIEAAETPEDVAAVHLEVSFSGDDLHGDDSATKYEEISTWLWTRRKDSPSSFWKKRYSVLSDGLLSYFEAATPRPHGLRGQLALNGATVEVAGSLSELRDEDKYVLCVNSSDEPRLLSFESEGVMAEWKVAIQRTIDSCAQNPPLLEVKQKKGAISKLALPASKMIRGAKDGGIKVIRSAKDGGMKVFRSAVGILRQQRQADGRPGDHPILPRRPSMQVLLSNTALTGKRDPTVQCVAQQTYRFAVSDNGDSPEPLFHVQAKVFQAFLLSGGKGGRLSVGDALVEIEFDMGECLDEPLDF
jgi:hypothetical protein